MSDTLTLQSATLASLPANTVVEMPADVGGNRYPGGWASFATATGTGTWVFQIVDNLAANHGLPTQSLDGAHATLGAKGDAAVTNPASAASVVALLKGQLTELAAAVAALQATLSVNGTVTVVDSVPLAVSGTFWQATQPVSLASLPPLAAGGAVIGHVVVDSGTVTTVGAVTAITNALPAGEAHLGEVAGNTSQVLVTVTRPADTNAYAANDSVNTSTSAPTVITFTNALRANGRSGYVTTLKLLTDQSANTARFRLHLFNVANPTLPNDNAAYAMKWADRAGYLGAIDLPACQTEGTGSDCARAEVAGIQLGVEAAGGDRSLYGLLETLDAFTPASAENFHLELMVESN